MATLIECMTLDCTEPRRLATFWAAALDYIVREDKGHWVVLRPASGHGPLLGFQQVPEMKVVKNRVHMDLRPTVGMEEEVTRLEGLGAQRLRLVPDDPTNIHTIMQDPEGNEFCVTEPLPKSTYTRE
jgi:Glyoxalase-like domain